MSSGPKRVIYNPEAGSADELEACRPALEAAGYEMIASESEQHAKELARAAVDDEVEQLVAAGGDGTVSMIAAALLACHEGDGHCHRPALGVLPLGTGNDFRRTLGVSNDLETAIEELGQAEAIDGDALRCRFDGDDVWAINVITGGTSGAMYDELTDEIKKRWGPLAYFRVGVPAAVNPPTYALDLTIDGRAERLTVTNLVLANGRYAGGGFVAAPKADLADGKIDVAALLPTDSLLETAELARKVVGGDYTADYTDDEHARRWHARQVTLRSDPPMPFTVDGENRTAAEASVEVVPGVLRVLVARPPHRTPAV